MRKLFMVATLGLIALSLPAKLNPGATSQMGLAGTTEPAPPWGAVGSPTADFRKDNGRAIRATCKQFVMLCRRLELFSEALVAIDGSKFKAVNNRDKNFTANKIQRRMAQIEASIDRYLSALETADRQEGEVAQAKAVRLKDKIAALKEQLQEFKKIAVAVRTAPDQQISLTDPDAR